MCDIIHTLFDPSHIDCIYQRLRGEAMQAATAPDVGAMIACLPLTAADAQAICDIVTAEPDCHGLVCQVMARPCIPWLCCCPRPLSCLSGCRCICSAGPSITPRSLPDHPDAGGQHQQCHAVCAQWAPPSNCPCRGCGSAAFRSATGGALGGLGTVSLLIDGSRSCQVHSNLTEPTSSSLHVLFVNDAALCVYVCVCVCVCVCGMPMLSRLKDAMQGLKWSDLTVPLISNVNGNDIPHSSNQLTTNPTNRCSAISQPHSVLRRVPRSISFQI
jgi:hypothetical protein